MLSSIGLPELFNQLNCLIWVIQICRIEGVGQSKAIQGIIAVLWCNFVEGLGKSHIDSQLCCLLNLPLKITLEPSRHLNEGYPARKIDTLAVPSQPLDR